MSDNTIKNTEQKVEQNTEQNNIQATEQATEHELELLDPSLHVVPSQCMKCGCYYWRNTYLSFYQDQVCGNCNSMYWFQYYW